MPREMIPTTCEPFHPKIGWGVGGAVQVGVEGDDGRSLFWMLLGQADTLAAIGASVRAIAAEMTAPPVAATDESIGRRLVDALDVLTVESHRGSYQGVWAWLDRAGCNRMIAVIRRARDATFGRDE